MAQASGMRLLPGVGQGSFSPERGKALVQELGSHPMGQEEDPLEGKLGTDRSL